MNGKLSDASANMFVRFTFCDRSYGPPFTLKLPSFTTTLPDAPDLYSSCPPPAARPKKPVYLPTSARDAVVVTDMLSTMMRSLPDVATMLVVGRSRLRYVSETDGVANDS